MKYDKSNILIAGLKVLSWLPLPLIHGIAYIIGLFIYWFPNSLKQTATINLQLCFPELSTKEQQRLLRKSLIESVKTMLEMGAMWLWPIKKLHHFHKSTIDIELWQTLHQQGNGVIVMIPHIGQWEFLGVFSQQYTSTTSLYRPPKLATFNEFLINARKRTGNILVPTTASGVKALYSSLKKGQMAAILPDQDPGSSGVFAPFFGIQTNTMTLITKLAQRTHAPIILVYVERLSWGRGYTIHIREVDNKAITDADPLVAATALNKDIEACIREKPEQYQWIYKRFKKRPAGEEKIY